MYDVCMFIILDVTSVEHRSVGKGFSHGGYYIKVSIDTYNNYDNSRPIITVCLFFWLMTLTIA